MTLRTGSLPNGVAREAVRGGFTLIELILVMALLLIAGGAVYPALQRSFRGRVLDAEARRLLAVTHSGQSRAVSEGVPIVLRLDLREGSYELAVADGYGSREGGRAAPYFLAEDLTFEVGAPPLAPVVGQRRPLGSGAGMVRAVTSPDVATIWFQPDGFIGETSPAYVHLREGEQDELWLVQNTNRLAYAIKNEAPLGTWR